MALSALAAGVVASLRRPARTRLAPLSGRRR
jgi:hypothetical protein